jgi:hypothetical protein
VNILSKPVLATKERGVAKTKKLAIEVALPKGEEVKIWKVIGIDKNKMLHQLRVTYVHVIIPIKRK